MIDKVVVVIVDSDFIGHAFEARSGRGIQGPAFLAVLTINGFWSAQYLALAAIKAGQVTAAGQCRPDDAAGIDVDAARCVTDAGGSKILRVERRLVGFANAGLGIDAHNLARHGRRHRTPDAAINGIGNHAVGTRHVDGLVDVLLDLAVTVDVVIATAPAL